MPTTNPNPTTLAPTPDARGAHRVALTALATMLVDANLPPAVLEHLKAAHLELVEHATSAPPATSEEGGIPAGESIAAAKRRANGEDPAAKDDEGDEPNGDDAPGDKAKGGKPNPLSLAKRWASSPTKDDAPAPKKAAAPAGRVAPGKTPRFFGRGR